MNINQIPSHILIRLKEAMNEFDIPLGIIESYNQSHRYFHDMHHIVDMLDAAVENDESNKMLVTIALHDLYYSPKFTDNEVRTVQIIENTIGRDLDPEIKEAILQTKDHESIPFRISRHTSFNERLNYYDTKVLYTEDFGEFMEYERDIFKEYQSFDYATYRKKRIEFLENMTVTKDRIDFVKNHMPKIAVFPGSFAPFHRGHMNILRQAEAVFDKVIIAHGNNPAKNVQPEYPPALKWHQIEAYDGLLSDFVKELGYDVTIIRGIRGEKDLDGEANMAHYLKDLNHDMKFAYFMSDPAVSHLSSSGIRQLREWDVKEAFIKRHYL